jgi:hypothetical protein
MYVIRHEIKTQNIFLMVQLKRKKKNSKKMWKKIQRNSVLVIFHNIIYYFRIKTIWHQSLF